MEKKRQKEGEEDEERPVTYEKLQDILNLPPPPPQEEEGEGEEEDPASPVMLVRSRDKGTISDVIGPLKFYELTSAEAVSSLRTRLSADVVINTIAAIATIYGFALLAIRAGGLAAPERAAVITSAVSVAACLVGSLLAVILRYAVKSDWSRPAVDAAVAPKIAVAKFSAALISIVASVVTCAIATTDNSMALLAYASGTLTAPIQAAFLCMEAAALMVKPGGLFDCNQMQL